MPKETSFSGPYVSAAFVCEKVLLEPGNVPTFVRVVDRFTVPVFSQPLPPGLPPPVVQANLIVLIKAGDFGAGRHTITIKLQKPDGSYLPDNPQSLFFNGSDDAGHGVVRAMWP